MPRNAFIRSDPPPVYGMNTVDDAKLLKEGECVKLLNMFPGAPPIPRNGCSGFSVTLTDSNDRFIPPAICFGFRGDAIIYIIDWVFNSGTGKYNLCYFRGDTVGSITSLGEAEVTTPTFGRLSVFSNIYCFVSKTLTSWKSAALALSHKVIESVSVVRDMCISSAGSIKELTQAVASGNLMKDECYSYAFEYVRQNTSAYFEAGGTPSGMILPPGITATYRPKRVDTFLPGVCIGVEDSANRKSITIAADDSKVTIDIDVIAEHATGIAQGATHLRVCRSRAQTTEALALAATHFFLTDLPIGTATTTFEDNVSDAALAGETNQLITGYTEAPAGPFSKYHKGRMFIMDENGAGYYSECVGGDGATDLELAQTYPQAWASLFKPTLYLFDCDKYDGIKATGMEVIENDIYFFKESKIFVIYNGDPTATAMTNLSEEIGCVFRNTIVKFECKKYGHCIFFMSNRGPYIIVTGGRLIPMEEFKIAELWPLKSTELYGDLFTSSTTYNWIQENCTAFFSNNTLWVSYKNYAGTGKTFGYYFDPNDERICGSMRFQSAAEGLHWSIAAEDKVNDKVYLLGKASAATPESSKYYAYNIATGYIGVNRALFKSTDLTTWSTVYEFGVTGDIDVCYGDDLFVAVGPAGKIITSTDGTTWTVRTSGTARNFLKVRYLNGGYYAWTSSNGTNMLIYYSADGTTWSLLSTISSSDVSSVVDIKYGASTFLMVLAKNPTGTIFRYSVDGGVIWLDTLVNETTGLTYTRSNIFYANSKFYASIYNNIYTSTDAKLWTLFYSSPTTGGLYMLGSFVNEGFSYNGAVMAFLRDYSGDPGANGDVLTSPPTNGALVVVDFLKKNTYDDIDNIYSYSTGLGACELYNLTWDGERFIITTYSPNKLAHSSDGTTWTIVTPDQYIVKVI